MNEITGSNNFNNFCTFQNMEKMRTKIATKENTYKLHCILSVQLLCSNCLPTKNFGFFAY